MNGNTYSFQKDGLKLYVTFYTTDTVRVTYGERSSESLAVVAAPENVDCERNESAAGSVLSAGSLRVCVRRDDLSLCFFCDDRLLTEISAPSFELYALRRYEGGAAVLRNTVDGVKASTVGGETTVAGSSRHARLTFRLCNDLLFGLGSHEEGFPCINGHFIPLYQENMRITVPRFVSDKGWAVLIDNASFMTFDCTGSDVAALYVDRADCVDFYVSSGAFDQICADYRFLTGTTPLPPKAMLGYIQSKCWYHDQNELLEVVLKYRELGVPLDVIVQDWQYWQEDRWGDKHFDPGRFPDMTACIDRLHEAGARLMISVWPNVSGDSPDRAEFAEKGMLLRNGSTYNAFDKDARDVYWRQAKEGLWRHGVDAWWCDCTEPFEVGWGGDTREPLAVRMKKTVEEFKKYIDDRLLNAYSLFHSEGIYRNQRAESDKRVFIMTRSGFAGQHRYGACVWSGDISATWETLKRQVHILQNYIATGEAYWNSDVGAFFYDTQAPWFWKGEYPGGTSDDGYKELYVRWLQFAGFTPLMRSHGMGIGKEIWQFGHPGEPYYEAIRAAIELRCRLTPFLYSVCASVTFTGEMPVKPLALAFPGDETARTAYDEYLYGGALLICPITEPEKRDRKVYLPSGVWYDFYNGRKLEGGRYHNVDVTMDRIPVFAKAGAVIPTSPVMNYTNEIPGIPYTVLAYPGRPGEFTLYDDNGVDYDYENGAYSRIRITYDGADQIRTVQLGKNEFAHPLIFATRPFPWSEMQIP